VFFASLREKFFQLPHLPKGDPLHMGSLLLFSRFHSELIEEANIKGFHDHFSRYFKSKRMPHFIMIINNPFRKRVKKGSGGQNDTVSVLLGARFPILDIFESDEMYVLSSYFLTTNKQKRTKDYSGTDFVCHIMVTCWIIFEYKTRTIT
jgi:hypothetical protein